MSEATNFNINIDLGSDGIRRYPLKKILTLDEAIMHIKATHYQENIKKELIKKIQNYPQGAYYKFLSHLSKHVSKIQKKGKDNDNE